MNKTRIIPLALLSVVAVATFTIAGPIASMFQSQPKEIQFRLFNDADQRRHE